MRRGSAISCPREIGSVITATVHHQWRTMTADFILHDPASEALSRDFFSKDHRFFPCIFVYSSYLCNCTVLLKGLSPVNPLTGSPGFTTAVLLGRMFSKKDEAQKVGQLLDVTEDEIALLRQVPPRGSLRGSRSGLKKIHDGISGSAKGSTTGAGDGAQSATQDILRQNQREKCANTGSSAATKVLNPFNGQPPGYNYRPRDSSNAQGPRLPPLPNNGSGGGGASLDYQAGKPGQYTRDIAVDVSGIQNGNGKGVA